MKQSPRCWNTTIHNFLVDLGFTRSLTDYATYTMGLGKDQVILALYVDDLLIMGENLNQVLRVKSALGSRFEMVDFGEVKTVLGMRITRNRAQGVCWGVKGGLVVIVLLIISSVALIIPLSKGV